MDARPARNASELRTLVELSSMVSASLDVLSVLDNAMVCMQSFLDAEASAIFELDRDRGELFFRSALDKCGEAVDFLKEIRVKLGEGIAGCVAKTRKPLIVNDAQQDLRFMRFVDEKTGFTTRSVLCVPMLTKGQLIGVIQVLNKRSTDGFDEHDLEMMTILANQIATALENAKLYTRLSEKFSWATEELKSAQEKLIRSERLAALGVLAQGVAHEVRNPVMVIGGFARRLKKELAHLDSAVKGLDIILNETERLESMVADIEKYCSLRHPELRPMSLVPIVDRALAGCSERFDSNKISVSRDFPEAVPEILADGELLEEAVGHVFVNAMEAMPHGGELTVSLLEKPETALLSVKDTGVGIAPEMLPNVFDPFFTSKTRGTGLGLTTVHRIVSDHSGEIAIASTPGEGTEVRIELPCYWKPPVTIHPM